MGGFDTVLIAVGGGGLIAGIATAIGDNAQVIGVEPVLAPTLHRALEAGGRSTVRSAAWRRIRSVRAGWESLRSRRCGSTTCGRCSSTMSAIVAARNELWHDHHLAVEHGAAAAYAALTSGAYRPAAGERVVVVVCGANTDPATLT